jgi:polyhydroxyalkanoate synthase
MDGDYDIAGQSIRVKDLDIPVFAVASKKDHIVPWRSAYSSVTSMEDVEFVLSDAGHIVGIINPPGKQRYNYWHGAITEELKSADEWLASSAHEPGSWWEHWDQWVSPLSAEKVAARFPGAGNHAILESAPGSYAKKTG